MRESGGLAELKSLQTLDLTGSKVTDAGLAALKNLSEIRTLYLGSTQVTDAGLKELKQMNEVQTLQLTSTRVTGVGFKDLHHLAKLANLDLAHRPSINDAGLKEIAGLKGLRHLWLIGTPITAQGLKELAKLKNLEAADGPRKDCSPTRSWTNCGRLYPKQRSRDSSTGYHDDPGGIHKGGFSMREVVGAYSDPGRVGPRCGGDRCGGCDTRRGRIRQRRLCARGHRGVDGHCHAIWRRHPPGMGRDPDGREEHGPEQPRWDLARRLACPTLRDHSSVTATVGSLIVKRILPQVGHCMNPPRRNSMSFWSVRSVRQPMRPGPFTCAIASGPWAFTNFS